MREIKFRAFYRGTMYHDLVPRFVDNKLFTLTIVRNERKGNIHTSKAKIMQFTGLKDKNGKEIYESDLVRIKIPIDENDPLITHGIYQVYFYAGSFNIDTAEDGGYPLSEYLHQDLEVIGNIYENSNLLKGE